MTDVIIVTIIINIIIIIVVVVITIIIHVFDFLWGCVDMGASGSVCVHAYLCVFVVCVCVYACVNIVDFYKLFLAVM